MRIKYSPCGSNRDTSIEVLGENTIAIDGETYDFDPLDVAWPTIREDTGGAIIEANRDEKGELWLTVLRFYAGNCSEWDTAEFHKVAP